MARARGRSGWRSSKGLGEPRFAGVDILYRGEDLTVLNVIWAPLMTIMPHDHRTWAVIGVYGGREDNVYWRRIGNRAGSRQPALARCRPAMPNPSAATSSIR